MNSKKNWVPKRACTSVHCNCNCCDNRAGRHCGQHRDGCHDKCG